MTVRLLTQVTQLIEEVQVRQSDGQAVQVAEGDEAEKKPDAHDWHVEPRGPVVSKQLLHPGMAVEQARQSFCAEEKKSPLEHMQLLLIGSYAKLVKQLLQTGATASQLEQ